MADALGNASNDGDIATLFTDSENKGSFYGFPVRIEGILLIAILIQMALKVAKKTVATEAQTMTPMLKKLAENDQLDNIQVPNFMTATGIDFVLDNCNKLDIFPSFHRR